MDKFLIPKSRLEVLRWCKFYYEMNPYINTYIEAAAQAIHCSDEAHEIKYNILVKAMMRKMLIEGECFPVINEEEIILLDSTIVEVRQMMLQKEKEIWLVGFNSMEKFVLSSMYKDIKTDASEIRIDDKINISQILIKNTPHDIRGISIIHSSFLIKLMNFGPAKEKQIIDAFWHDVRKEVFRIAPLIENWFKNKLDLDIELKGVIKEI